MATAGIMLNTSDVKYIQCLFAFYFRFKNHEEKRYKQETKVKQKIGPTTD